MSVYLIWAIAGFVFLFLEILNPTMFFLNLAAGAFLAAVAGYYYPNLYWVQILVFTAVSILCILFLRPLIIKNENRKDDDKYVGHDAKVTERITKDGGKVKIYDEIWPAKSLDDSEVEEGAVVKISKFEDMTLFVEKI